MQCTRLIKILVPAVAGLAFLTDGLQAAECPLAHTHIGVNPTWRPDWNAPGDPAGATDSDPTDDNQLWFFSIPPVHAIAPTPGWPDWAWDNGDAFLLLTPAVDPMGDPIYKPGDSSRILYESSFLYSASDGYGDPDGMQHLDGWHSAHGPQGAWNLESVDSTIEPDWSISIVREGTSVAENDFFMVLPDGTGVLTDDGDEYALETAWLEDMSAWGFHEHMSFNFWLAADGSDQGGVAVATFSAYDASGMYTPSDAFDFRFAVVPEPAGLTLLAVGAVGLFGRRRRRQARS